LEHPVYSSCSKGSGWADPSSAGFMSPIERDKIDAGRSPHFIKRADLPRADYYIQYVVSRLLWSMSGTGCCGVGQAILCRQWTGLDSGPVRMGCGEQCHWNWVLWRGSGHPLSSVDWARFWSCPYGMWWAVPLEQICLQVLRFSHGVILPVMCAQPCHLSPMPRP
jgi:hypothetical protein